MSEQSDKANYNLLEESTVPLYYQLMNLIKREIHSGILKEGDMIPSESQLCAKYGVSRSTVRQALNQLVEENLIIRRRGKGSFIASRKLHRNLSYLYSFTEDMLAMGLTPHSKVLEKTIIDAPSDILNLLDMPAGKTQVFKLTRLRMANNEPLLLETTYIPLHLCPDIVNEDFSSASLYSVLRTKYNLDPHKAIETYESIKLSKEVAGLLGCKKSTTAFNIQRIAYLDTDIAFELTYSIARSDKCIFKVELYANKNKINFSRQLTP